MTLIDAFLLRIIKRYLESIGYEVHEKGKVVPLGYHVHKNPVFTKKEKEE
jgi:N-methylhydantoinase A/oxoprolinase/acetone carboxylase beta subunit